MISKENLNKLTELLECYRFKGSLLNDANAELEKIKSAKNNKDYTMCNPYVVIPIDDKRNGVVKYDFVIDKDTAVDLLIKYISRLRNEQEQIQNEINTYIKGIDTSDEDLNIKQN